MKVRDVMHTQVQSVPLGTPITKAFELMQEGGFRHLPVLNSNDLVIGIVSDRDLRSIAVVYKEPGAGEESFFADDDTKVDEVMASDPLCVHPGDDLTKAVQLLRDQHIGCLVVTENDRLAGVLSYLDLLDVLNKLLERSDATAI